MVELLLSIGVALGSIQRVAGERMRERRRKKKRQIEGKKGAKKGRKEGREGRSEEGRRKCGQRNPCQALPLPRRGLREHLVSNDTM